MEADSDAQTLKRNSIVRSRASVDKDYLLPSNVLPTKRNSLVKAFISADLNDRVKRKSITGKEQGEPQREKYSNLFQTKLLPKLKNIVDLKRGSQGLNEDKISAVEIEIRSKKKMNFFNFTKILMANSRRGGQERNSRFIKQKNRNEKESEKTIEKNLELVTNDELIDFAIIGLKKPPDARTPMDIKTLKKCTEKTQFFQDLISANGSEAHEQICRFMTHKYMKEGQVLFYEGSVGVNKFEKRRETSEAPEQIQEGTLIKKETKINSEFLDKFRSVVKKVIEEIKRRKMEEKEKNDKLFGSGPKRLFRQQQISLSSSSESEDEEENYYKNNKTLNFMAKKGSVIDSTVKKEKTLKTVLKNRASKANNIELSFKKFFVSSIKQEKVSRPMYEVKVLLAGSAFGELALMERKPRAATIICKENTHFAVLDKVYFDNILKEKEMRKLYIQIDFFASMKIFAGMSYNAIKNIFLHSAVKEFKFNTFVYKQKDTAQEVYLIKSGEFKLVKEVQVNYKADESLDKRISMLQIPKASSVAHCDIAILRTGESFGEDEVISDEKRTCAAVCMSLIGTVYVIKKKEFMRRIYNEEKAREFLQHNIKQKQIWHEKRVKKFLETSKYSHNMKNEKSTQYQALVKESNSFSESSLMPNPGQGSESFRDMTELSRIRKEPENNSINLTRYLNNKVMSAKSLERIEKSFRGVSAEKKTSSEFKKLFQEMGSEMGTKGKRDKELEKLKIQIYYRMNKKFDSSFSRKDIYSRRNKMNFLSQVSLKPRIESPKESFFERYDPERPLSGDEIDSEHPPLSHLTQNMNISRPEIFHGQLSNRSCKNEIYNSGPYILNKTGENKVGEPNNRILLEPLSAKTTMRSYRKEEKEISHRRFKSSDLTCDRKSEQNKILNLLGNEDGSNRIHHFSSKSQQIMNNSGANSQNNGKLKVHLLPLKYNVEAIRSNQKSGIFKNKTKGSDSNKPSFVGLYPM